MKHITLRFAFISSIFLLIGCNDTIEKNTENDTIESTQTGENRRNNDEHTLLKDTIITSLEQESNSINTSSKNDKSLRTKNVGKQPQANVFTKMSEIEYWEWRKSKYYFNDSINKRTLYKNDIYRDMDITEFEQKFAEVWRKKIEKIEKNNVSWDHK